MAMLDDVSAGNVSFISVVIILGKPLLLRKFHGGSKALEVLFCCRRKRSSSPLCALHAGEAAEAHDVALAAAFDTAATADDRGVGLAVPSHLVPRVLDVVLGVRELSCQCHVRLGVVVHVMHGK